MSIYIYVEGQREDVERVFEEIIYPDFHRLREDDRFRVTLNDMKYRERNKKTHVVERMIRGYSPTLKYKNRPGLWEQYFVDYDDVVQIDIGEKVKGFQIRIHLRSNDPSEVKLIYDEMIETKTDLFTIEKDTGLYINRRDYASRILGGHFSDTE